MRRICEHSSRLLVVGTTVLTLAACGGGGGGSSRDPVATTNQVTNTPTPNAELAAIADNTYKIAYTVEDVVKFGQYWSDPMITTAASANNSVNAARAATPTSVPVNCPISGRAEQTSFADQATGTLTREILYFDCTDPAATANGRVQIVAKLSGNENGVYFSSQTATFTDFNLSSADENLTLNGTTEFNTADRVNKTFTINLTIDDLLNGEQVNAENIRITAPVNAFLLDRFYQYSIVGKMHFSGDGTLDFNKTDPNSTKLELLGKDGSSLSMEALNVEAGLNGAVRRVLADSDADGVADRYIAIPWTLYYPKGDNTAAPAAVINPATPVTQVNTATILSAELSTDADYNLLSFSWALGAAPAGATATLTPVNGLATQFSADLAGDYEVLVTVSDGTSTDTEVTIVTVQ